MEHLGDAPLRNNRGEQKSTRGAREAQGRGKGRGLWQESTPEPLLRPVLPRLPAEGAGHPSWREAMGLVQGQLGSLGEERPNPEA